MLHASILARIMLIGGLIFPALNQAACDDPSPLVKAGKSPRDFLTPHPIGTDEYRQIRQFLSSLAGHYHGSGTTMMCILRNGASMEQTAAYDAEGDFSKTSDTELRAEIKMKSGDSSYTELLAYTLEEKVLMAPEAGETINITVLTISDNELTFNFKTNIINSGRRNKGGTRPLEQTLSFSRSGKQLDIKLTNYIMGFQTGWTEWRLTQSR